ncbi:MAG: 4-(cytidine 5'-diphospho)-2-C-methyl-D-erythritol kinase [Phycisphaeraceae bacterium]
MPTPTALELPCPAKVNLALSVGPPNRDGLHPIASWMVTVHFGDHLVLERADAADSTFDIAFDTDAPVPGQVDWPIEQDLTWRAAALLQQHVGHTLAVRLTLRKRVPAGSGLGGGSSDAASTLVGLNRLFEVGLDDQALMSLAMQLGSDVAFFVAAAAGQPSAVVSGFGQQIEPVRLNQIIHLVLVFPPFGCPTDDVYRDFDRLHPDASPPDTERVHALASMSPPSPDSPFNDLADAALDVQPKLADLLTRLRDVLDTPVHVTGSGSALFVIAPSDAASRNLACKVTALTGLPAVATRTR